MTKVFLYRNDSRILGSDGLAYIDGRLNVQNIKRSIRMKNATKEKNFPHLVATGFELNGKIYEL